MCSVVQLAHASQLWIPTIFSAAGHKSYRQDSVVSAPLYTLAWAAPSVRQALMKCEPIFKTFGVQYQIILAYGSICVDCFRYITTWRTDRRRADKIGMTISRSAVRMLTCDKKCKHLLSVLCHFLLTLQHLDLLISLLYVDIHNRVASIYYTAYCTVIDNTDANIRHYYTSVTWCKLCYEKVLFMACILTFKLH